MLQLRKASKQIGGGKCSICGYPGTNKTTCPWNENVPLKNRNYAKHGPGPLKQDHEAAVAAVAGAGAPPNQISDLMSKVQHQHNYEALKRIRAIEEANGQLLVNTNIPDPRISGYYIYQPQIGCWYNREKDVYLYHQDTVDHQVVVNLAKLNRFTPSQLANYKLFSFARKPFDALNQRLAFIETMSPDGFRIVDGIVTPVGSALINGEAYGLPKESVLKYGFSFA